MLEEWLTVRSKYTEGYLDLTVVILQESPLAYPSGQNRIFSRLLIDLRPALGALTQGPAWCGTARGIGPLQSRGSGEKSYLLRRLVALPRTRQLTYLAITDR